jgi:beta-lactamase class D
MFPKLLSKFIICILFLLPSLQSSSEENFLLINGLTDKIIIEMGSNINEQISPCSSFKIVLSLMGYDAEILKDEHSPEWDYHEGYDDYAPTWKNPLTPQAWMKYSCIWYSKILARELGHETIQSYLALFMYGNQDISGGSIELGSKYDPSWVTSSLKISPKEQVEFIQKMIEGKLQLSKHAIEMTKAILFKEEMPNGWKLFGKTGWSGLYTTPEGISLQHRWFVGWIEKDSEFYPFAYLLREPKIDLQQQIPRVKALLIESGIMNIYSTCS